MEALLPQLLAFPPNPPPPQALSSPEYDKQIRVLIKFLHSTSAAKLKSKVQDEDGLLDVLDPSINTLPYLYALLANTGASNSISPSDRLWGKMLHFMTSFDPVQVRYAGHEWRRLIESIIKGGKDVGAPLIAIEPVRTAMLRLDPTSSTFTSTHLAFAHTCLMARAYDLALPILDKDIYHFPSPSEKDKGLHLPLPCASHMTSSTYITTGSGLSDKLSYREPLQYFLYGAMIYLAIKSWDRALLFLELNITTPTVNTASMIQVEGYKKWILAQLLLKGCVPPLPRTVSSQTAKHYHVLGKAYEVLSEAFKDQDPARLYATAEAGEDIWQSDRNTGLVVQVLAAHRRFAILSLSKVFTSIPLTDVMAQTSAPPSTSKTLDETYAYINGLISSGHLKATLSTSDPSTAFLCFNRDPTSSTSTTDNNSNSAHSESQNHAELLKQKQRIEELGHHMQEAQRKLEFTKEYLDATRKAKKNEGNKGHERTHTIPEIVYDMSDEEMLTDF